MAKPTQSNLSRRPFFWLVIALLIFTAISFIGLNIAAAQQTSPNAVSRIHFNLEVLENPLLDTLVQNGQPINPNKIDTGRDNPFIPY